MHRWTFLLCFKYEQCICRDVAEMKTAGDHDVKNQVPVIQRKAEPPPPGRFNTPEEG